MVLWLPKEEKVNFERYAQIVADLTELGLQTRLQCC